MDRRERMNISLVAIQSALAGMRADMWTAMPGIIDTYNAEKCTAAIQITIQAIVQNQQGVEKPTTIAVLPDVPVIFPGGGAFALTFPLAPGDEGLVVFASRCIDAFWQQGGIQPQAERRMHDLSDGLFIPARLSQPKKLDPAPAANTTQLRNADGTAYIELAAGGTINVKAPGGFNVEGNMMVTGNLAVTGTITWPSGVIGGMGAALAIVGAVEATAEITAKAGTPGSVTLSDHVHGGVQAGAGSTSPPTAGT